MDVIPGNSITHLEVGVTKTFIQAKVHCNASSCKTIAVRNTTAISRNATLDAYDRYFFYSLFLKYISEAMPIDHYGTPQSGLLEKYLFNSSVNPFRSIGVLTPIPLFQVGPTMLALGLEKIFNTYWMCHLGQGTAAGSFEVDYEDLVRSHNIYNTTGSFTNFESYYHFNTTWLALLLVASLLLLIISLVSAIVSFLRIGPDATDFMSGLTRSYQIVQFGLPSYLDCNERIRLLPDLKLRIGDLAPEEDVGRIVIGPNDSVGTLRKERFYW